MLRAIGITFERLVAAEVEFLVAGSPCGHWQVRNGDGPWLNRRVMLRTFCLGVLMIHTRFNKMLRCTIT